MVSPASDFGVTAPNDVRLQKQEFLRASFNRGLECLVLRWKASRADDAVRSRLDAQLSQNDVGFGTAALMPNGLNAPAVARTAGCEETAAARLFAALLANGKKVVFPVGNRLRGVRPD
jgi:hypothetical protein